MAGLPFISEFTRSEIINNLLHVVARNLFPILHDPDWQVLVQRVQYRGLGYCDAAEIQSLTPSFAMSCSRSRGRGHTHSTTPWRQTYLRL